MRVILDSLKTAEGLDQRGIGLSCLVINRELSSGDFIVSAFVRTCVGASLEQQSKDMDNVGLTVVLKDKDR